MGLLVVAAEAPEMRPVFLDPILKIGDRVAADAELDQVK
jgi:hypothetical protein